MENTKNKKIVTPLEALQKARKYCAYSERCHFDVSLKLREWEIDEKTSNWIITELIQEKFLNEERFAMSYTRGKFNQNKWGKNKIKQGLRQKKITDFLIKKALQSISDDDYYNVLKKEVQKYSKEKKLKNRNEFQKILYYLNQKGFETELIIEILKELKKEEDGL
jgi:regulatory protein